MLSIKRNIFFKVQCIHHLSIEKVICIIIYWFGLRRREFKDKIPRVMKLEGENMRSELLNKIATSNQCYSIIRMGHAAFMGLSDILVKKGGIRPTL